MGAESSFVIREATRADADGIAQVHVDSWQVAYRGQIPDDILDALSVTKRAEGWRANFDSAEAEQLVLVAEDGGGRIIGFATSGSARLNHAPPGWGELGAIYLDPNQWRQGLGRRLLTASEGGLRQSGFRQAMLYVLTANERARRFYESMGWSWDGTEKMYETGPHQIPEVRYTRPL